MQSLEEGSLYSWVADGVLSGSADEPLTWEDRGSFTLKAGTQKRFAFQCSEDARALEGGSTGVGQHRQC